MPIRHYTIDPPFNRLPGDVFIKNGTIYEQWRDDELIDSRDLTQQISEQLTEPIHFGGDQVSALYLEVHMPGVMATLVDMEVNEVTGQYFYRFGDGTEREFGSRASAMASVNGFDTDVVNAQNILILQSLRKDQQGANARIMVGQTCAIDCAALNPVIMSQQIGPA